MGSSFDLELQSGWSTIDIILSNTFWAFLKGILRKWFDPVLANYSSAVMHFVLGPISKTLYGFQYKGVHAHNCTQLPLYKSGSSENMCRWQSLFSHLINCHKWLTNKWSMQITLYIMKLRVSYPKLLIWLHLA